MTTENAIAKTLIADEQGTNNQETRVFYGRPIASNEIDNSDELMGYLD
ncbi:MAG: hypothetical protein AB4040_17605 [Synechococcus sp.]